MNQAPDIAVVARARKLLNMSKDAGASENEREMAASKFQAIMMEHNISMATVEASNDTSTVARRKKESQKGRASYDWQQSLMRYVAETNFCFATTDWAWKRRRYAAGFTLVGREENVVAATVLYDYLCTSVERLAREYVGGNHQLMMSCAAMSFKDGCSSRLRQRLHVRHKEAMAAQRVKAEEARASGSNALVPFMEDFAEAEECANEDFRLNLAPGTTAMRRRKATLQSKAYETARNAVINDKDIRSVNDPNLWKQAMDAVVDDLVAASGFSAAEVEEIAATAKRWAASDVREAYHPTKSEKRSRRGGRRYRGGFGRSKRRDHDAFEAGNSAGNSIGLDTQVGSKTSNKGLLG